MIRKIATVGIYVDDQDKAFKFWTEKVGFELKGKKDMGNGFSWLEVGPTHAESALVIYPKKLMANYAEQKASIVFLCDNIENFCQALKQKGVTFIKELEVTAWGKFASFSDEDGNKFGLKI